MNVIGFQGKLKKHCKIVISSLTFMRPVYSCYKKKYR